MIPGRVAGCDRLADGIEVYRCDHFNEPVIKQGHPPCLDTLREQVPGATGRTCRECQVPRVNNATVGIVDLNASGHCDVLHVMGQHWWPRGDKMCAGIPPQITAARKIRGTLDEDRDAIAAVSPRVVAIHALEHQAETVRALALAFPAVAFICIFHGSQNVTVRTPAWAPMQREFLQLSRDLPNVWYATPEPTIPWQTLGYPRAILWPNTMQVQPISELPPVDPPVLLLAGRMDLIKCYPVAILAAGLVNRVRPVRVVTVIQSRDAALDAMAEVAGVPIEHHPWMEWDGFHQFVREHVSVTVCPSLTDSFHYVAWDSLSQGRPAVGSQTTRYLPAAWQADPNDPRDVARIVLKILDDYGVASRQAWSVADELARRQRVAYLELIERVTHADRL